MADSVWDLEGDQKEKLVSVLKYLREGPRHREEIEDMFGCSVMMNEVMRALNEKFIANEDTEPESRVILTERGIDYIEGRLSLDIDRLHQEIAKRNYTELTAQYVEANPIIYNSTGLWWRWDKEKSYWKEVDEVDLLGDLHKKTLWGELIVPSIKSQLISGFKLAARARYDGLKKTPSTWLQFENEIMDIATGEKFAPSPEYFIVNRVPWKLGSSEETPTIDMLFGDWSENKELLYEICAYCCLPDQPIHRIFCLYGQGRNGKSTFQKLIKKFVGEYNCTSTDVERLKTNSRFEMSRLYKKTVCFLGETTYRNIDRTDILKSITGEDSVSIEWKGSNRTVNAQLYSKLIMGTNNMPRSRDKSIGWSSRWIIVKFNTVFKACKNILDSVPDKEFENLALKCTKILPELLERGSFKGELSFEEKQRQMAELSDPLETFINEFCLRADDDEVPLFEFKDKFKLYCKDRGFEQYTDREITRMLEDKGFEKQKRDRFVDGARRAWWYLIGVSWKAISQSTYVEYVSMKNIRQLTELVPPDPPNTPQISLGSPPIEVSEKCGGSGGSGGTKKAIISNDGLAEILLKHIDKPQPVEIIGLSRLWDQLSQIYLLPDMDIFLEKLVSQGLAYCPKAGFIQRI